MIGLLHFFKFILLFDVYVFYVRALPADVPNCGNVKAFFEARNTSTKVSDVAVNGESSLAPLNYNELRNGKKSRSCCKF